MTVARNLSLLSPSLSSSGTVNNIGLTNSSITINGTGISLGQSVNTGTVTSVGGTGTVSGLTLTGTVTSSGNLTLGGTLSLTSGQVTTALGFTPYNATNPSGYITSADTATNVSGTVAVANGGTGQTSYTNGQLLIGNTTGNTLAKATLTQGTGISITNGAGAITITNSAPDQTVALTQGGATTITGTYPNFTISSVNTTYSLATSTVLGLIELGSDTTQTVASNAVTATASRSYALQVNADGQGVVNVPWTDTNSGGTVTSVTAGTYLTGGTITTTGTLAVDATSANTASKVVARDASGNFSAGLITSTGRQDNYGIATNAGTTAGIQGGTSGGTIASPTQTLSGTTLYKIAPLGHTGSGWTGGAALEFVATENITATNRGTNAVLSAIAAGGATATSVVWNGSTLVANGVTLTGNTGTVTSVGGTGTVSGLTLSGTVTTSGNLSLGGTLAVTPSNFTSQIANTVLAAPNGAAGVPTFRVLVDADIPNLDAGKITTGVIDAARLPSYVDDVVEAANLAGFPATGETGKIYVALDTNKVYRWSGSAYVHITSGAVDSVAGKTGVVTLVKADVGLGNVDNTADSAKSVASAATLTTARTIGGVSFNGSANINLPGVNTAGNQNTTGTAANVTGTVAVANGGTGQTSYTNGQLLIGNTTGNTLAKATLTQGTGISITNGAGAITVTNTAPDQTVALTGAGATSISGTYPNFTITSTNTTYSLATSTVLGLIELGSNTQQTVAANAVSATASRTYALQVNADGQGVVNVPWTDTNSGGTVTSVGLAMPAQFTVTNSPVTTSGTLTAAWASQTQNTVLAAPSGAAGVPTFRALVAADIPTLNQNTTGTAANVTGTVAVANGGTGATTAAAARTNLGATTLGGNVFTLANVAAIAFPRFNADNTVSTLDAASFRTAIGAGTGSGTVTSVATSGTVSGLTLTGGTITTTGTITLGGTLAVTPSNFASQTANTVLAAPNGAAGAPTFRAIVAADIPTLNQNTTGTAANVTGTVAVANGGTGATTAAGARTNLGATTLGGNLFTLANVAAIAFPRFNADNTVSSLDAASFRTAIGAATSSLATSTVPGLIELGSDTAQTVAANAVTATASRTYALQLNAAGQGVVNVPWTDTNSGGTVTSVSGTGTVGGLTLSGTVTTTGNLTLGGSLTLAASGVAGIVSTTTQSFSGAKTLLGQGHGFGSANPSTSWNTYFKGSGAHPSLVVEGSGASGSTGISVIRNGFGPFFIAFAGSSSAIGQQLVTIDDQGSPNGGRILLSSSNGASYGGFSHSSSFALVDGTQGTVSAVNSTATLIVGSGNVRPASDNTVTLGTSSFRWGQIFSGTSTISTSDRRIKYDIQDLQLGLDFITALKPVEYKITEGSVKTIRIEEATPEQLATGTLVEDPITQIELVRVVTPGARKHAGFIAQEVKDALGQNDYGIWCLDDHTDADSRQSLRYEELISPLVKAVQELHAKVLSLEARLASVSN
jgi:hypothetical protein